MSDIISKIRELTSLIQKVPFEPSVIVRFYSHIPITVLTNVDGSREIRIEDFTNNNHKYLISYEPLLSLNKKTILEEMSWLYTYHYTDGDLMIKNLSKELNDNERKIYNFTSITEDDIFQLSTRIPNVEENINIIKGLTGLGITVYINLIHQYADVCIDTLKEFLNDT